MKQKIKHISQIFFAITILFLAISFDTTEYLAFPAISVEFDAAEQSVIVSGVPAKTADGGDYELRGSLNYGSERIETFCYAPNAYPYHVAATQAYIFNWADAEFLLPCSGEYQFTAYLTKISNGVKTEGPKTTINIHLTKKDESTNWGPGLPSTTVEVYDLNQIQGNNTNIVIEEEGYSWTINGATIESVPAENLSLAITPNPASLQTSAINDFFGDTIASTFSIDYDGTFGFDANLKYFVGTEYTGKYANLFYVAGNDSFEFIEGVLVDENGYVSYAFTHASDYVIAVTDVEYTGQELNQKENTPSAPESSTTTVTETNAPTPILFICISIGIVLITICVIFFIKKHKS